MALSYGVVSNLKTYSLSVMWEIELKSLNIRTQQSITFLLFGEEWYFKLERYSSNTGIFDASSISNFKVRLFLANGAQTPKTAFFVTCYAIANGRVFEGSQPWTVTKSGDLLLTIHTSSYDFRLVPKGLNWKIYCHFGPEPLPTSDFQQLSHDFSRLLDKEIIPDATVTCGTRTWKVHRSVLTVRSEVFAAMFQSGSGAIRVEDMEPDVLDSLLKYVYGGKAPFVSVAEVYYLYQAASRYAVLSLRKLLSDWMAANLSVLNCLGFVAVADAHGDRVLKEASMAFIIKNFAQIGKAEWDDFMKRHLPLGVEILARFAPAMKQ